MPGFPMVSSKQQGYIIAIIAITMWSSSEICQKLWQQAGNPPLSLSFLRFFVGALSMIIVMAVQRDFKGLWQLFKRNWGLFLISSAFAFGISNYIYFIGMTLTNVPVGSAIYTSYPIYITIYCIFLLGERENLRRKGIGLIIGFFGVAILLTQFNILGFWVADEFIGNMLVLVGAVTWSLYSVLGKKIQRREANKVTNVDVKFSFESMAIASITNLIPLFFLPEGNTLFQYDAYGWMLIIILGVVATGLGVYVFFIAVKKIEMSQAISLAYLKPVISIILAFFILGNLPSSALLVAIPIIFGSIFLINWPKKKANITSPEKDESCALV